MEREGEGSPSGWSCVTNWEVAKGSSLEASISFDTSDEDAPPLTSDGTLLLRPASDEPPPCEVTVFFRGKHEIHRVYARTTARIFEIYYTKNADVNSTKEYLCTVKCGPVASDENLHGSSQNSSVHSSEEESWINVNSPGSSPKETQMHFEATAEISDSEACASLTLRFLSLQTKSTVHVEEIYIYADPVEESTTTEDSSNGTTSGYSNTSSLFAMLVPNLLQMRNSGLSSRINERYFSPDRIHSTHDADSSVAEELRKEVVNHREKNNYLTHKQGSSHEMNVPVATDKTVPSQVQHQYSTSPDPSHARNSSVADARKVDQEAAVKTNPVEVGTTSNAGKPVINESTNCAEKLLEQLIFKVEKIEAYFSKFEDKMLGPISSIESRMERLENQFSLLTNDLHSLQIPHRETCPLVSDENERSQETASFDNSVGNGVENCQVETKTSSVGDAAGCQVETNTSSVCNDMAGCQGESNTFSVVGDGVADCQIGTKTSAGTTFKAPDCMSEYESDDDGHCGDDDTVHDDMEVDTHVPNKRKPISIDGALASALAAFATESSPNVSTGMGVQTTDPDLIEDTKGGGMVPEGTCPFVEGVPLVSIYEVQINTASDLLSSFEAVTHAGPDYTEVGEGTANLDDNLHQVDVSSEVGPTEGTFESSDHFTQFEPGKSMNEDLHQVEGDVTTEMGPTKGLIDDSDIQSHIEPVLFSKSVIGEVSDEEEVETSFVPDSPQFACNSPLSSSDFEPTLPNYDEVLKGWGGDSSSSTDSSIDENFLRTKMQMNLSDDVNTECSTFSEASQKFSVSWDGPKLDPFAVLLDGMTVSDMSGTASSTVQKENTLDANNPFIDLEGIPNSGEVDLLDRNMPQFESLI